MLGIGETRKAQERAPDDCKQGCPSACNPPHRRRTVLLASASLGRRTQRGAMLLNDTGEIRWRVYRGGVVVQLCSSDVAERCRDVGDAKLCLTRNAGVWRRCGLTEPFESGAELPPFGEHTAEAKRSHVSRA
jgi:hypothetical protein